MNPTERIAEIRERWIHADERMLALTRNEFTFPPYAHKDIDWLLDVAEAAVKTEEALGKLGIHATRLPLHNTLNRDSQGEG